MEDHRRSYVFPPVMIKNNILSYYINLELSPIIIVFFSDPLNRYPIDLRSPYFADPFLDGPRGNAPKSPYGDIRDAASMRPGRAWECWGRGGAGKYTKDLQNV